jgi:hypothetical protein
MRDGKFENKRVAGENPEVSVGPDQSASSEGRDTAHQDVESSLTRTSDSIGTPPVPARTRAKRMSRRAGQNPKVRVGKRANGEKYFFFQYWVDVLGQEERKRLTEVIGSTKQITKSEAERKKLEFISKLQLNSDDYRIPSSRTFADAVKHYREVFAPGMLRDSTFSVADGRIKNHLEADWNDVPIEHITIDSVNQWAWKKKRAGLSWMTIKDTLRTMQRVL